MWQVKTSAKAEELSIAYYRDLVKEKDKEVTFPFDDQSFA